jgi:hypothetical protein
MMYKAKRWLSVLRHLQNTQSKASTMHNVWMLNPVVREVTAGLWKVKGRTQDEGQAKKSAEKCSWNEELERTRGH